MIAVGVAATALRWYVLRGALAVAAIEVAMRLSLLATIYAIKKN